MVKKTNVDHLVRFLTRIVKILLIATMASGCILQGQPQSTATALPNPQPTPTTLPRRPGNIILIITDDQNVDSLPVMRNLMAFPEGSWVNFTNAYASNSICCPSRATILTGQYSHVTGVINNAHGKDLDDTNTLPVWLEKAGYRTGLIGKYLNHYPWDRGAEYIPPGWQIFEVGAKGGVSGMTNMAVDFINTSNSPFFLYLAYYAPHHPAKPQRKYRSTEVYIPPDPPNFNEADVSEKPQWIRDLPPLSPSVIENWRAERLVSQQALLGVDDGVQQIIEALKAKGQVDHTMIIFMSDNGFSWGSHRFIRKQCAYEECSKIPLLIRFPTLAGNREEPRPVSNVDLAATIADYAVVTPELPQNGHSLIPLITDPATDWKGEVLLERSGNGINAFCGIRVPGWKYIEYVKGDRELYDLDVDPYELKNLANQPEFRAKQNELEERLRALGDCQPG